MLYGSNKVFYAENSYYWEQKMRSPARRLTKEAAPRQGKARVEPAPLRKTKRKATERHEARAF